MTAWRAAESFPTHAVIEALPVTGDQRIAHIETANFVFERVIDRIELESESLTRKLWDPDKYIDSFLNEKELSMKLDYAGSLDAFLVHHVIGSIERADEQGEQPSN